MTEYEAFGDWFHKKGEQALEDMPRMDDVLMQLMDWPVDKPETLVTMLRTACVYGWWKGSGGTKTGKMMAG